MFLFDLFKASEETIDAMGAEAVKRAKQSGVSVFYSDSTASRALVEELPDGSFRRLDGKHIRVA